MQVGIGPLSWDITPVLVGLRVDDNDSEAVMAAIRRELSDAWRSAVQKARDDYPKLSDCEKLAVASHYGVGLRLVQYPPPLDRPLAASRMVMQTDDPTEIVVVPGGFAVTRVVFVKP